MKQTKKVILKRDGEEQEVGPRRGCKCGLCQRDAVRGRLKGTGVGRGSRAGPRHSKC